jgi:hypothetical protein
VEEERTYRVQHLDGVVPGGYVRSTRNHYHLCPRGQLREAPHGGRVGFVKLADGVERWDPDLR